MQWVVVTVTVTEVTKVTEVTAQCVEEISRHVTSLKREQDTWVDVGMDYETATEDTPTGYAGFVTVYGGVTDHFLIT